MENKTRNIPIIRGQSSSSVMSISNQNSDDGTDDADDEDNSSIPSHFLTSNNFILPPFVSSFLSHAYSPSIPSIPVVPVVPSVTNVAIVSSASVVPAVPIIPIKFHLTLEQAAMQYKDLIGSADK
jgi:hypothetical protein